jgi:vesicle coat complex subunit
MSEREKHCYFIVNCDDISEQPQPSDIQTDIVKGTIREKKRALKILIKMITNDQNFPRMPMVVLTNLHIIDDHDIKKLLFLYWEVGL